MLACKPKASRPKACLRSAKAEGLPLQAEGLHAQAVSFAKGLPLLSRPKACGGLRVFDEDTQLLILFKYQE
jgi:hypothetical protein